MDDQAVNMAVMETRMTDLIKKMDEIIPVVANIDKRQEVFIAEQMKINEAHEKAIAENQEEIKENANAITTMKISDTKVVATLDAKKAFGVAAITSIITLIGSVLVAVLTGFWG